MIMGGYTDVLYGQWVTEDHSPLGRSTRSAGSNRVLIYGQGISLFVLLFEMESTLSSSAITAALRGLVIDCRKRFAVARGPVP